jgi:CDP-glucose 4,6-dehydratase
MGAHVYGFALEPDAGPALYRLAGVDRDVTSSIGDLRDEDFVRRAVKTAQPELVVHMAAQAIVRRGIAYPAETFAVNVQGTAHLFDALRDVSGVRAVLVITSDKVYANEELGRPFKEEDRLGGKDPYSASKAAAELLTRSYGDSFFERKGIAVATARAGNIIGGGDFAADRLLPDLIRALQDNRRLELRHPEATRPWQHVLDCVCGYLLFVERLASGQACPRALNFGPDDAPITVAQIVETVFTALGLEPNWNHVPDPNSIEMKTLAVDPALAHAQLEWRPRLAGQSFVQWTAEWYRDYLSSEDARALTHRQIADYINNKSKAAG